jgi:cytoskeletal protein CcmA (bactofilin family)
MDNQKPPENTTAQQANLGKSVIIKGEVSGSEDLYLDGQVEGAIDLKGNRLTLGPNGRVKANINARSAVIHGKLEGNITASDRVDLKQSAIVTGDIVTQRISIDEGAFFKGGVDISRAAGQPEGKSASTVAAQGAPAPGPVSR